jgi:DNA-binding NarL/FixJ family response regulator
VLKKLLTRVNARFRDYEPERKNLYGRSPGSLQMAALRILIADDKPLVRTGIRMLIESHENWTVCGEAADGIEAVEQATQLKPDVILLDISMPKLDGLAAAPLIREKTPDSQIIVLTLHESLEMARIASKAGVSGYVTKSLMMGKLVPAIEELQDHKRDSEEKVM